MEIEADESFKQAGVIPFKWEIRPGVPKLQHAQPPLIKQEDPQEVAESRPIPETPRRLKPPPAADFNFQQPIEEPRNRSFRSAPRARSDRHVLNLLTRPAMGVASDWCFPSPLLKRTTEKNTKKKKSHKTGPEPEPNYLLDLETVSRWSVSSRKSISPFHDSLSSSFSSRESSPRRPVSDADWVGFALF